MRGRFLTFGTAATAALAGTLLAVGVASADGGPHKGPDSLASSCGDCHKTHTAQGTSLLAASAGIYGSSANGLCFSCHDGTGAGSDVYDGASISPEITTDPGTGPRDQAGILNGVSGALRGGGFVFARIATNGQLSGFTWDSATQSWKSGGTAATQAQLNTASNWTIKPGGALPSTAPAPPGQPVTGSHIKVATLNGLSPQSVIWGNGAIGSGAGAALPTNYTLQCIDCHDPHGGAGGVNTDGSSIPTYRVLRLIPKANNTAVASGTGVLLQPQGSALKKYTTDYWNMYTPGASGQTFTNQEMSTWCAECHTRYAAGTGSGHGTGSGDAIFNFRHPSDGSVTYQAKAGSVYSGSNYALACLQCHVAHGGNARTNVSGAAEYKFPGSASLADINTGLTAFGGSSYLNPTQGTTIGYDTVTWVDSAMLKIDQRGTCVACHGSAPGSSLPAS